MSGYAGDFAAGGAVFFNFSTYDSNGASVTVTGLAAADVQVYKDGGLTQRSSAAGITAAADFDGLTGQHQISINLSDNTDAGFYAAGHEYQVFISPFTCDGQTVGYAAGTFSIERANGAIAMLKDATNGLTAIKTAAAALKANFAGTTFLKQSTAATVKVGPFIDAAGALATTLTIQKADVRISKNGAAYAGTNADQGASDVGAAYTELGNYNITFNATDTDTLGRMRLGIAEVGATPVTMEFMVLAPRAFEALMDALGSFSAMIAGTAATGTLTTSAMTTSLTGYNDDRLIGATVIFQGGALDKERARIADYTSVGGLITFAATITGAPVNGQAFIIV